MTVAPVRLGAHAVTWNTPRGDDFTPWLAEVSAAGYEGVSLFAGQLGEHMSDPGLLRANLDEHGLRFVAVTAPLAQSEEEAERMLAFMAGFDVPFLAYVDNDPSVGIGPIADLLNARGHLAAGYGIKARYHNRAGGVAATRAKLEQLAARLDPASARLMLDVGHATRDFDEGVPEDRAADFLDRHLSRIDYLEFKDFSPETDLNTPLGEGVTDFPRIFSLIRREGYGGWITVEQNGNLGRSRGRTAYECAVLSREYLRAHGF